MLKDTRGGAAIQPSEAVVKGLGSDGGLYIFTNAEDFKFDESLVDCDYAELAEKITSFVFSDMKKEVIAEVIERAYSEKNFPAARPVEVKTFNETSFMELWHGPTHAFKDVALTVLGNLMVAAKRNAGETDETLILTATSGDTGSATLSGFDGTGINAIVLYPDGGVSPVQEAQMHRCARGGSRAIAVKANFDFCQTLVKKIFTDENLRLEGKKLSSANSINIGRLVPQIVYYFYTYAQLVKRGVVAFGDKINFCVPTGNFGNILAGYLAKKMHLPVNRLICASNKNDVLTEFFNSGVYDRKREFYKTVSPSMDILVSSNLERLLYLVSDCDEKLVNRLMGELSSKGEYVFPEKYFKRLNDFFGYKLTDEETERTIKEEFEKDGYLIDPHTAVALGALKKYRTESGDATHTVVASTANPYKFPEAVADGLGIEKCENIFDTIEKIEKETATRAPEGIKSLKNFNYAKTVWSADCAEGELRKLIGDRSV